MNSFYFCEIQQFVVIWIALNRRKFCVNQSNPSSDWVSGLLGTWRLCLFLPHYSIMSSFGHPPSGTALAFSHTLISMLAVDPLVHDVCVFCHLLYRTTAFMISCDEETTLNTWLKHVHTKHGDNLNTHWLKVLNNKGLIKLFSGINCLTCLAAHVCSSESDCEFLGMLLCLCHGPAGVPRLATRCLCVLSTWLVVCWCHVLPCRLSVPSHLVT